ncbi:MAG TPA: butyrate kinase [Rectinemataceae bacterium]|nr:butyrate kinase [Rectinemataceae bacterium]
MKVLAINPGSTSTKIAVYDETGELFKKNVEHSAAELEQYPRIADQYKMRYEALARTLEESGVSAGELSAVVGRGGLLPPVKSGAYRVNESMVDRLTNRPLVDHASNLGGVLAWHIAQGRGIPAYIYDPVAVDELEDIARLTGLAEVSRKSFSHALNMRATAIKCASALGRPYRELNLIVAHLGGGITLSVHSGGRMVDIVSDDEGPFSPERAGRLPWKDLLELCYASDMKTMQKRLRGKGGLVSHLGTNSTLEVEAMIAKGDARAKLVYEALAYQVAKAIGELATVVEGRVDRIALTGGIAHSALMTGWIKRRVAFIAPVEIYPGENELESLANGALRVLRGEEEAREYDLG